MIKKEQPTDTCHKLKESHQYYAQWKKTDTKKEYSVWVYIWSFREGKTHS